MSSAVNRLQQMNTPMECPRCGSTHFYEVHAQQFAHRGYGSSEYHPLSVSPVTMKVCLCGLPVSPQVQAGGGKTAVSERERFYFSLQQATAYMKKATDASESKPEIKPTEVLFTVEALEQKIREGLAEIEKKMATLQAELKAEAKETAKTKKKVIADGDQA